MRVKDLTKQYDGKTVVDSVSFEIPKGKVISMIGPNGAGKSTVLNIISRLIARDSGLVDFDGRDIGKWKSKELAKRLAMSPTTLADRFKRHPWKWTIAQLWTATAVLHIPAEEIDKALCAGTKRR